ncbi:DNA-directed DNA polymerase [Tanacetum coccineum]
MFKFSSNQFAYLEKRLTIDEMLAKFIKEGMKEHKEIGIFIRGFRKSNELLLKEQNNLLIKGVTTRGGKMTSKITYDKEINEANNDHNEPSGFQHDEQKRTQEVVVENESPKENEEAQQRKLLENLRQLHINISFIEALVQMPKYAKYLKNLLTNKSKLEEACTVMMNERCSPVLLNKLPSKEKDPWRFTIPCQISNLYIDNALADLRASISLMPYTMYEKLGLGEPKPTRMSLELADRSIQYPRGIVENVLIKVGDDEVIYDMEQSMKKPFTEDDECYSIEDLDETINEET